MFSILPDEQYRSFSIPLKNGAAFYSHPYSKECFSSALDRIEHHIYFLGEIPDDRF
ncbi:MAG: hypothetical protein O3B01_30640 [Planctomycetota bacterium]|nr:hypothetical protein [Planctomycetota bacterium]MDA1142941.1 hypothetical protein [Planctomycetota bacterium]